VIQTCPTTGNAPMPRTADEGEAVAPRTAKTTEQFEHGMGLRLSVVNGQGRREWLLSDQCLYSSRIVTEKFTVDCWNNVIDHVG
jgi:hypothetical protein